jgi:hypothetical protein
LQLEAEATQRAITVADQAGAPVMITPVMSKSSANVISAARRSGQFPSVDFIILQCFACSITLSCRVFNKLKIYYRRANKRFVVFLLSTKWAWVLQMVNVLG